MKPSSVWPLVALALAGSVLAGEAPGPNDHIAVTKSHSAGPLPSLAGIEDDPVMMLDPGRFDFDLITGQSDALSLNVANTGGGALDWTIDLANNPGVSSSGQGRAITGDWSEGFESISQLPGNGWALINNSDPPGTTNWFQGGGTFPPHDGPVNSYIQAAYHNTAGLGTISNWLMTPEIALVNGTRLSFWTRTTSNPCCADRLEVRLSTAGDSTDAGDSAESTGVFGTRLLSINENLASSGYPSEWTRFEVVVEGLDAPTTGRFALRYYVTDGGIDGSNSNWIGIDTVEVTQPCASFTEIPWLTATPDSGTTLAGEVSEVTVGVDTTGLPAGEYTSLLCVAGNDPDNAMAALPVSLSLADPEPVIHIDPSMFTFDLLAGEADGGDLTIANSGNVDLDWDLFSPIIPDGTGRAGGAPVVLLDEDFAGTFPPGDWSVVDAGAEPCPWLATDDYTLASWSGSARAAAVDSDDCLTSGVPANTVDSALLSPSLDLSGLVDAVLTFDLAYRQNGSSMLSLEASIDGGENWTGLQSWVSSFAYPGNASLPVSVDLSPFDGQPDFILRWRYRAGWDWWAVVDNVEVVAAHPLVCHDPAVETWLSAQPASGTASPGQSQVVDLTVDATELDIGQHVAGLCIFSGDLDNPQVTVPVIVNVLPDPTPILRFTPEALDFGNVEIGSASQTFTATLENIGDLDASGLSLDVPGGDFILGTEDCGMVLEPGQACTIEATFAPSEAQPAEGTLAVHSDQGVTAELLLTGNGVTLPVIEVGPASMTFDLHAGEDAEQTLSIGNTGTGELAWTIEQSAPDSAGMLLARAGGPLAGDWEEGFNDISQLPGAGWGLINNSEPLGTSGWSHGSIFLPPHQGPPGAFIAASFNNTTGGDGIISNWLLTPEIVLLNGTELSFWTRTTPSTEFPDRLEIRLSTAGDSVDVGDTALSTGSFDQLLLSINEDLTVTGYPESWTRYAVTVQGLTAPASGRFAFRYFVTDAGPDGVNSEYIGIDTVGVTQPGACAAPEDIPWLSTSPTSGITPSEAVTPAQVLVDTTGLVPGDYTAQLCVSSNDSQTPLVVVPVALTVTEPPTPILAFSPASIDFGSVELGSEGVVQVAHLQNTGDGDATGLSLIAPGSGFGVDASDCGTTLSAGQNCQVEILFEPLEPETVTRIMAIESAEGASALLQLLGTGVAPPVDVIFRDRFEADS